LQPHRVRIPVFEPREDVPSRFSVTFFNGPDVDETVTPFDICKTPEEIERLAKLGKTYSSASVNAYEQVFGKVNTVYSQKIKL
jgi:isopenicillin N synthase-like dioxygenase